MTAMKIAPILLVAVLAGCNPVPVPTPIQSLSVIVINSSGAPVAGAEVFLGGELKGTTDGTGKLVFSSKVPGGAKLVARHRVYEHPSYRPGTTGGWLMRVYQTSRVVNNDGSVTEADPKFTQTLTVSPSNALIGWHLIATLDWDASAAELNELETRFNAASQYLYNLTDGQFFIEQVDIADDGQLHVSAEIAFKVDSFVWPHATYNGGFLAAVGGLPHIYMAPFGDQPGTQDSRTLVHELGHLAFGLQDEYAGPIAATCTLARSTSTANPDFRAITVGPTGIPLTGSRAACVMDRQFYSNKLCSAHADSFHANGTWQPGPCWNTVIGAYSDPGRTDRWIVRTPDMRGAVVGTLADLPKGWGPKVNKMNEDYPDLCQPIIFVDPSGAAAANGTVWVRPSSWRNFDFTVGRLDSSGILKVRGVHAGDTIKSPFSMVTVNSTMCTVTH